MNADFDREATWGAIRREALCLLAYGLALPFGLRPHRPPPVRGREARTLVLVHGLGGNRGGFLALRAWLRLAGHRRQLAFDYRSRGSVEALALRLKRHVDAHVRGGRIDVVAHSMGGLVARTWLQCLGGSRRVDRLVTLGTPHRGTHAAVFVPSPLVRQLQPTSRFLERLNALPPPPGVEVTSFVAGRDLLVQPVESASCPFGGVRRFDELGHLELLFSPAVFRELAAVLAAR